VSRQAGKKRTTIDLEFERTRRRYDLAKWTFAPAIWLAASWVPLHVAESFSGHKTTVTVSVTITIVVSIAGGGAVLAMYLKSRKQREEILRLRVLNAELEGSMKGVAVKA
jgi:phosphotransferase system  glucose/maltose/N-acetylglucosamine-specific IIC component